jgi:3-carboxy-cis,cis-muconate cycloisomerase
LSTTTPSRLLGPLFATDAAREIFSDRTRVQRMLDIIAALARAEARVGVIPKSAVHAIESSCRAEPFDIDALARATATAGNPAIPLVKELTARVRAQDAEAAGFVHWGTTSQDTIDTALVLQLRAALVLFEADTARLARSLAALAEAQKHTVIAGRTLMQQALPVTFGLKVAGWLSAVDRHRVRLRQLKPRVLVLQFGGAAGSLAALGDKGIAVAAALAEELKLVLPDSPWHTQRDRVAELATELGLLVGSLGKIARDVSLMMQTEIGEAFEPHAPGRGGSSTMPHKRNPVDSAVVLAAALRAPALVSTVLTSMVQEHERGLGGWHAEWETLPQLCELCSGALDRVNDTVAGLDIDAERMRENLAATHGLIFAEAVTMALGRHIGRMPAYQLVEGACRRAVEEKRPLREVLNTESNVTAHLPGSELDRLFDPSNYLGSAVQIVDRVLAQHRDTNLEGA